MSWLDDFLTAYNATQSNGVPVIQRQAFNFTGAGVTATDDPSSKTTTINIPAAAAGTTVNAKAAAPGNVAALTGSQSIDGVSCGPTDIVLLPNQTATSENGLWIVGTPWTRTNDALTPGLTVFVQLGATQKGRTFVLVSASPLRFVPQQSFIDFDAFGGIGDGDLSGNGTDNSTVLAEALLALAPGGRLSFGPFIYALMAQLTLAQSNVTLQGHLGATVLVAAKNSDYDWIIQRTAQGSNLKIEDIIFDANQANRGGAPNHTNTHPLGCLRLVNQDNFHLERVIVRNTIASESGGETVGCQIVGSTGTTNGCQALDCGTWDFPSDGFYVAGGQVHTTNYSAQRITDHGYVLQNANNSSLVGFSMLDCQAGFGIGCGIGGDQVGVVVGKGTVGCTIGAASKYAAAITGATTATPVVVHSPAHGLPTGTVDPPRVYVSGVKGMPEINGMWVATIVDADHYSLANILGSPAVGTGTYVSGGFGQLTYQASGFDLGTFGSSGTGTLADELRDVIISDVVVDNRTNIGDHAITFWAGNSTQPPATTPITIVSIASPGVVTAKGHGFINGQKIAQYGVRGVQVANGRFLVANKTTDTYQLHDLNDNPVTTTGTYVSPFATTITSGSNGVSLPTGTINVVATAGLPTSGTIYIETSLGTFSVNYTGTTGTTLTGCTGGAGVMSTGFGVTDGLSGFTQACARTRNVKMKNVRAITENIFSYAFYANNVDNLEIENCDFRGDANPTIDFDGKSTEVRFRRNLVESYAVESMQIIGGHYRFQCDENTYRGKDGVTAYGPVFADSSTEVFARRNLCTGSSIAAASSTPAGVFTHNTVISQDEVDLATIQTVGGAKTWTAAAEFSSTVHVDGKAGFGQAPSNAEVAITSPGSNTLAISMLGGSNAVGVGFGANGEFGGLSHDIPTVSGVVRMGASVRGELGLTSGNYPWTFTPALYFRLNLDSLGAVGIGAGGDPSGSHTLLLLSAGTANYSPMQITPGSSVKTTPANGDVELTSTNLFVTIGGTRFDQAKLYGTSIVAINIGVTALTVGQVATNTGTVTGAAVGDLCIPCPTSAPDAGIVYDARVSAANTVTMRITCVVATITTTSTTYNVRVMKQ